MAGVPCRSGGSPRQVGHPARLSPYISPPGRSPFPGFEMACQHHAAVRDTRHPRHGGLKPRQHIQKVITARLLPMINLLCVSNGK